MVDVDQLRVQLAKLDDQLVQWSLADYSIFERERQAGTPADEIMKMILNDRRERVIAGVPDPNDELLKLLDHIMDEYLRADETTRGAIRGAFNGKDRVLYSLDNYIARAADKLAAGDGPHWLHRGLAAASILDGRLDLHDTQVNLGYLYRAAARAGLDPVPAFREVAALSSNVYPGKMGSTREMLETFHKSDYFREAVEPDLNG